MLEQNDVIESNIQKEEFTKQKPIKSGKPFRNIVVLLLVIALLALAGYLGYKYGVIKNQQVLVASTTMKDDVIVEDVITDIAQDSSQTVHNIPNTSFNQVINQYCEREGSIPLNVLPFALSNDLKSNYGLVDKINCYCEEGMSGCVNNSFYLQTESPGMGSLYFVNANSTTIGHGHPFFEYIAFPGSRLSSHDLVGGYSVIADTIRQPIEEKIDVIIMVNNASGGCEISFPLEVIAYGHKLSPNGEIIATVFSRTYEVGNPYWMVNYNNSGMATTLDQINSLLDESLAECTIDKYYANNHCYVDGQWICDSPEVPDKVGWSRTLKPGVSVDEFLQKLQVLIAQLPIYNALQKEVETALTQITF